MSTPTSPTAEPAVGPPRWGWGGWALVGASFLVGFANFPLQTVGRNLDHFPGDIIDNRLNLCVLEHGYRYLCGKTPRFWDIESYYPARGVTAWSDAHIGMLPLYSALRAGGFSPERAFQGWFLIPFVLNFAAAAWGARRLGVGAVGSAVTGYVFAYALPLAGQLGHGQLFPRFLVPPAIVFAWEWLRAPCQSWRLAVSAACVVYQTYISVYIGYFLGLTLLTGGVLALVVSRGKLPWRDLLANGRVWLVRGAVVVGAAAALNPLVSAHRGGGSEVPKEHVRMFAPRPLAWITPPGMAATAPELARYTKMGSTMPGAGEEQLLPGLLVLGAVAFGVLVVPVALVRGRFGGVASAVAVAAPTALLLAVLVTKSAEPDGWWYYGKVLWLPGATGIRSTSRVVLVLLFPAGFALGAIFNFLTALTRRRSRMAAGVVAGLALGLVAIDQRLTSVTGERKDNWWWARRPLETILHRQGRVAAALRQHPDPKLVYVFPGAADGLGDGGWPAAQLDAMRAAQDINVPTANGWSGHSPPEWSFYPNWLPPAGYRELLTWLTVKNQTPPDVLAGLVVIGEPKADADPAYEATMRAQYPPRAIPDRPE